MVTIKLKNGLKPKEEQWLAKNVGPRLHYMHNSVGGEGWLAKLGWSEGVVYREWTLTFQEDKYASWFLLMFPQ